VYFQNLLKFLQKLVLNKRKLHTSVFVKFRPQTQNMNFPSSREKFFEKKCASIFSKVGSKESQGNTEEKVGLRQPDFLKF
jgi:hypothetical protein